MKVAQVQARSLKIPIKFPFTETTRTEGMLLAQVETDDGIVGAGISRDSERFAVRELINREIGPFLLGGASPSSVGAYTTFGFNVYTLNLISTTPESSPEESNPTISPGLMIRYM